MAKVFLRGLGLSGYRAIGAEMQYLAPFQEVNFIVGPNNVGKSAILSFLRDHLARPSGMTSGVWSRQFSGDELHDADGIAGVRFTLGVSRSELESKFEYSGLVQSYFLKLLDGLAQSDVIWLHPTDGNTLLPTLKAAEELEPLLKPREWSDLWTAVTRKTGGGIRQHWIPQTLAGLGALLNPQYPRVRFIPAIRQIGDPGAGFNDFSGAGLIDRLAELQSPPHNEKGMRLQFQGINRFLQLVTGVADARIEVPFDKRHVQVQMNGRILPLSSLGTGVHEVVMIASFCTLANDEIVCIEEPEIHLHPLLQRRLMKYLADNTSNQYFVATHSAALLDSVDSAVFSVEEGERSAVYRLATRSADRHGICRELGYRASDLLQSNVIVWVEGPSDRIYLQAWLRAAAPDLVEGVDFSIMFYGGRLLSHLSALDDEVSDFIALRRLNRNVAIVIDSDRRVEGASINETKRRVATEIGEEGFVWITEGREIENYLSQDLVTDALRELHGSSIELVDASIFGCRIEYKAVGKDARVADKIKVARAVAARPCDLDPLDLRSRVGDLVQFIRRVSHR